MSVKVHPALNDPNIDARSPSNQRQMSIAISTGKTQTEGRTAPLNLCLILDRSGSMAGKPLNTVKEAACQMVDRLSPDDLLSVVAFDHKTEVLVASGPLSDPEAAKDAIASLKTGGGTSIDGAMKPAIEELAKGKQGRISQAFLLTDGENEHGDNDRALKLAELAVGYNITLNCLGFGDRWNQDVLEKLADAGGGTLSYIEDPQQVAQEFGRLFDRARSVQLTNAHLLLTLSPEVRLAELKPIAQVSPETIELTVQPEAGQHAVRLGDLMADAPRVVLVNLYVGQLEAGRHAIARLQVRYDDPAADKQGVTTEPVTVEANAVTGFVPAPDRDVQQHVWALAKYRQTQIAESKLKQGDRSGAATLLQAAAKTALQLGDDSGATVLQTSATRLQAGEELTEGERKKTRIASKTILKP